LFDYSMGLGAIFLLLFLRQYLFLFPF
jgi:hypothetical protein